MNIKTVIFLPVLWMLSDQNILVVGSVENGSNGPDNFLNILEEDLKSFQAPYACIYDFWVTENYDQYKSCIASSCEDQFKYFKSFTKDQLDEIIRLFKLYDRECWNIWNSDSDSDSDLDEESDDTGCENGENMETDDGAELESQEVENDDTEGGKTGNNNCEVEEEEDESEAEEESGVDDYENFVSIDSVSSTNHQIYQEFMQITRKCFLISLDLRQCIKNYFDTKDINRFLAGIACLDDLDHNRIRIFSEFTPEHIMRMANIIFTDDQIRFNYYK